MTPVPQSALGQTRSDVLAPTASSLRMRAVDGAASAAATAPRVADPPQAVAADPLVVSTQTHWTDDDVMTLAVVSVDDGAWYVSCGCGYTTGYCESNAQASRTAALHQREAHAGSS